MKHLSRHLNSQGFLSVTTIILLVVLGVVGYGGWQFARPWWNYYSIKNTAANEAFQFRVKVDDEIRAAILRKAEELGLPLTRRDIRISHKNQEQRMDIRVTFSYETEVNVFNLYRKSLAFEVETKVP